MSCSGPSKSYNKILRSTRAIKLPNCGDWGQGIEREFKGLTVLWQSVMLFVFPIVSQDGVSSGLGGLLLPTL